MQSLKTSSLNSMIGQDSKTAQDTVRSKGVKHLSNAGTATVKKVGRKASVQAERALFVASGPMRLDLQVSVWARSSRWGCSHVLISKHGGLFLREVSVSSDCIVYEVVIVKSNGRQLPRRLHC